MLVLASLGNKVVHRPFQLSTLLLFFLPRRESSISGEMPSSGSVRHSASAIEHMSSTGSLRCLRSISSRRKVHWQRGHLSGFWGRLWAVLMCRLQ